MQEAGLELLEILVGKFVRQSVSFMEHVGSMGNTFSGASEKLVLRYGSYRPT
jgi:hypothetical protein